MADVTAAPVGVAASGGVSEIDPLGPGPVTGALPPGAPPRWQRLLWDRLARHPRPALVVALLVAWAVGAAVAAAVLEPTPSCTSTAVMLIDDPYSLATAGDTGQLLKLDELRYEYASLASTSVIAGPVARQLQVPVGAVLGAVSVDVPSEALLLDVTAAASGPRRAQRLAATEADELTRYVSQQEAGAGVPATDRFSLTVVDAAPLGGRGARPWAKAATDGIAAAAVAGLAGFVLAQLVRHRRLPA